MKFTAVQMIGTQRSGSNLLRLMLNQLKEVSAPHPPHILEKFIPLLPAYGDLSVAKNFSLLVHDVCSLVAYNPVKWNHINLKENEIIHRCATHSLINIVKVIYEMNAVSENANIWMCKSLANIYFTHLLEANIKPYYIFLYRDGRDVACSFKRAVVGEKHVYHIAKQWQQEQELCIALKKSLGDERVMSVCYENLILQPQKELVKICDFIGANYNSSCLEYYDSAEAKNTASAGKMWQNVEHKIITVNYNNYRKKLDANEIILFEKIAGNTLQTLGYKLNFANYSNEQCTDSEIKMYNELNQFYKLKAREQQKHEDAEKCLLQEMLINNIKKRLTYTLSYNIIEKIAV
ncbi:MAG: sulfotransferase family protein [Chitinophagaceae bacterium]